MKKLYVIPRVTVLFFISLLPIIILSSMGFRLDIENQIALDRTHNLRLEINNLNSKISVNNSLFATSQSDIFLPVSQLQKVSLSLENHKTETFEIFGSFKNATKISNFSFLPDKFYATLEASNSTLLDKSRFLAKNNNKLEIVEFSINAEKIGKFPLVGETSKDLDSLKFEKINSQLFFDKTNSLAIYYKNNWQLQELPKFADFALKDGLDLFFIDAQNNLGIYNLETQTTTFIGQKASKLANNSNFTWIYWQDKLLKIDNSNLESKVILDNLGTNLVGKLEIKSARNYNFVKFGELGFLVDKFGNYQTLSKEMLEFVVYDDLIIWATTNSKLITYNVSFKNQFVLGNLPKNVSKLAYNFNLSRIFVYTNDSVFSTWFAKDLQNFDITNYPNTKWIENQSCQPEMEGDIQICKDNNQIYFYDSTN